MKYNNLTIVFGILFGLAMLPLAYLNLVLGIALAFAGAGDFISIMIYAFVVLAGMSVIGSCFARKCVWVPRAVINLTLAALLATICYLAVWGILLKNILIAAVYIFVFILGILATAFAWKAQTKKVLKEKVE